MARALHHDVSDDAEIADVDTKERTMMNEKTMNQEHETKKEETKKERARLTVEVPTDITAGRLPDGGVHCYCSRSYCCS